MSLTDITHWVSNHWENLLAILGLGSGSGVVAQKISQRKELKQIEELEKKVFKIEKDYKHLDSVLVSVKNEVSLNTAFDKQFRSEVEKQHVDFKEDLKEVKGRLDKILHHLLNKQ